jgi:hypothetical protein
VRGGQPYLPFLFSYTSLLYPFFPSFIFYDPGPVL